MGAVLSPLLAGKRFPELADLPKASSLCGACNEVCPVNIPIPDLLLRLRARAKEEGAPAASAATPPMQPYAMAATHPFVWKSVLSAGHLLKLFPVEALPLQPAKAWTRTRTFPGWQGGQFRRWFKEHTPHERKS